jgi:hypothetical protein
VRAFNRRTVIVISSVTLLFATLAAVLLLNLQPAGRSVSGHTVSGHTVSLVANNQHHAVNPKALMRGPALPPLRPGEVRVPAVGAVMMPPTARQRVAVRVSSVSAQAAARRVAPLRGFVTGSSTTRLMVYTNVYGPVRSNGTMAPSVPATLSWIVTFARSVPLVSRPITFKGKMPAMRCQYVAVISAATGRQLDAYQVCHRA